MDQILQNENETIDDEEKTEWRETNDLQAEKWSKFWSEEFQTNIFLQVEDLRLTSSVDRQKSFLLSLGHCEIFEHPKQIFKDRQLPFGSNSKDFELE